MRVGVVTTSYPRRAGDAAGNFVAAHVEAMRAMGHEVEVIAAGGAEESDEGFAARRSEGFGARRGEGFAAPVSERFAAREEQVVRVGGDALFYRGGAPDLLERHPIRAGISAAMFSARLAAAVLAHAHRWDRIVAHWIAPCALAALPARAPLVAIAHGGDIHTLRRAHLLGPALCALRRATIVFVSEELRAIAAAHAPRLADALVQPMGIDVARFQRIARAPAQPPEIFVAARLVPIKGVDVAIEAMRHLPEARLVIAGDGPERAQLQTRARALPVEFLGEIPAIEERLARAAVVAIPSRITPAGRTEGTPMIALEAMAAGAPIVASRVGGLAALPVSHVPPDDPLALARALRAALTSPAPAYGNSVSALDWRVVAPRLLRGA